MCRGVADWNYIALMPLDWFTDRAFFFSILNPYRKSSWEQATEKTAWMSFRGEDQPAVFNNPNADGFDVQR